jgi:hypothetical protein
MSVFRPYRTTAVLGDAMVASWLMTTSGRFAGGRLRLDTHRALAALWRERQREADAIDAMLFNLYPGMAGVFCRRYPTLGRSLRRRSGGLLLKLYLPHTPMRVTVHFT